MQKLNTKLKEPDYFIYHYKFTAIDFNAGVKNFSVKINDNYFPINQNHPLIHWVYRIESELLKIENGY